MSDVEVIQRLRSMNENLESRVLTLAAERDQLRARLNEYEAITCGHPGCLVEQMVDLNHGVCCNPTCQICQGR